MAASSVNNDTPEVKSCGFFVMKPDQSFLLMKHKDRYDLPKGHMEAGESELQTAKRELLEETGIKASEIDVDLNFRFEHVYYPVYKRFGGRTVKKTIVVFLARLKEDAVTITVTEHPGYEWFKWSSPPVPIEPKTVDGLIAEVHKYLTS